MDFKKLSENLELEEEEFLEIVGLFIETSVSDLNRLQWALETKNAQEAERKAHSIKGAAASLGFKEIFEISKNMERKARDKNLNGAVEMVKVIREELDRIAQHIHESQSK
jgi:HPt (histidine-containing phosphotransfer) domain-containing protein